MPVYRDSGIYNNREQGVYRTPSNGRLGGYERGGGLAFGPLDRRFQSCSITVLYVVLCAVQQFIFFFKKRNDVSLYLFVPASLSSFNRRKGNREKRSFWCCCAATDWRWSLPIAPSSIRYSFSFFPFFRHVHINLNL